MRQIMFIALIYAFLMCCCCLSPKKKQADEGALSLRIGNTNKEYDARCPIAKEFLTL